MLSSVLQDHRLAVLRHSTRHQCLARSLLLLAFALALVGCTGAENASRDGRILLWHDWDTESAAALDRIIAEFGEIYPDVEVVPVAVPPDEFAVQFTEKAKSGFGPDLILADSAIIYELAEAGFLRDLAGREGSEAERFLSTGYVQLQTNDGKLYGLPMSNHTQVLFYDQERVSAPVTTTNELFAAAQNGQGVAMDLSLPATFWLLGTEYGGIINPEGVVTLEQGGNVNWLQALQSVDASPGFIVGHEEPEMLQQALIDGDVAYLVGDSRAVRALRAGMGADRFGMTTLPRGHWGVSASPILYTDGLAISVAA